MEDGSINGAAHQLGRAGREVEDEGEMGASMGLLISRAGKEEEDGGEMGASMGLLISWAEQGRRWRMEGRWEHQWGCSSAGQSREGGGGWRGDGSINGAAHQLGRAGKEVEDGGEMRASMELLISWAEQGGRWRMEGRWEHQWGCSSAGQSREGGGGWRGDGSINGAAHQLGRAGREVEDGGEMGASMGLLISWAEQGRRWRMEGRWEHQWGCSSAGQSREGGGGWRGDGSINGAAHQLGRAG